MALSSTVVDQAEDVIRGLQATVAQLREQLGAAYRRIEVLEGEKRRLAASARRAAAQSRMVAGTWRE